MCVREVLNLYLKLLLGDSPLPPSFSFQPSLLCPTAGSCLLTLPYSPDLGVQQYFAQVWFAVWRGLCWAPETGRESQCDCREHAPPGRTELSVLLQLNRPQGIILFPKTPTARGSVPLLHSLSRDMMIKPFHQELIHFNHILWSVGSFKPGNFFAESAYK